MPSALKVTEPCAPCVTAVITLSLFSKLSALAPLVPVIKFAVIDESSLTLRLSATMSTTAVTLWLMVKLAELNEVEPPRTLASTTAPLATVVEFSIATKVKTGTAPLKSGLGAKRNRSDAVSVIAEVAELTVDMSIQVVPASVEYCQAPLALFSV